MSVVLLPLFFLCALIAGLFGIGGGGLYTPLQLFAGISFNLAATNSLFLMAVSAVSSSIIFSSKSLVDWKLVLFMLMATVIGSFSGGYASTFVHDEYLMLAFLLIVTISAGFMIKKPLVESVIKHASFPWVIKRFCNNEQYCINLAYLLPMSFVSGILSGMLGLGGGLLLVPIMVMLLHIPIRIAIASSAVMVTFTSSAGFAGRVLNIEVDWHFLLITGLLTIIGGRVGAQFSLKTDKVKLKKYFGYFLVLIVFLLLLRKYLL